MAGADNYVIVRSNGVEKSLRTWMLDELLVDAVAIPDVHIPANVLVVGDDLVSDSNPLPVYLTSGDISTYVDGLETLLGTSNTALSAISSTLSNVSGFVDGLETLLGTTNSTLTTVNSSITTLAGYVDQMEGYNDGVETLLGTVNTNLTTLIGHVDGLETLLGTIDGRVDGLEALIGTTNTNLSTLAGYLDGVETLLLGSDTTAKLPSCAGSTNATNVKSSAGKLYQVSVYNNTASLKYLKIYNKASSPTVGSDTPIFTWPIPANGGFVADFPKGHDFSIGLGYAMTTGAADADTGAVTAGDLIGLNIAYK